MRYQYLWFNVWINSASPVKMVQAVSKSWTRITVGQFKGWPWLREKNDRMVLDTAVNLIFTHLVLFSVQSYNAMAFLIFSAYVPILLVLKWFGFLGDVYSIDHIYFGKLCFKNLNCVEFSLMHYTSWGW